MNALLTVIATLIVSAVIGVVLRVLKGLYAGNIIMRSAVTLISLGMIAGAWIGTILLADA